MLAVFGLAHAAGERRSIEFINAATEPVYAIRVGHHAEDIWSKDLLGPMRVIEIGDTQRLPVRLQDTCWYDVRYRYGDGRAREIDNVDLCSAHRVFLRGNVP